ncbi:RNA-binding transcriptional accessory protein [Empedobacter brevis]|uniref:RNA-binding transcriptional accessory protein n=1 Tax=Empedobacter brevis TaxID=247 RepID=A0AAJ1QHM5_9FLAO|nr:Tex family protein [Empedobacter brevis]MDM1074260.1 RNA-binding transcriptional accessory protein [Empedobacter brevis]QES91390.1 RNA-binding transcriptional accessory protein [Empedobacter brevis]QHC86440.1 RNA-binding transcriptional accessory protein [Empedobacter brevis]
MNLIQYIHQHLNSISEKSINNTVNCLKEDNTIPFIARYRKELTGNLDEVQISAIKKLQFQYEEIVSRKEFILKTLHEQDQLTNELQQRIQKSFDLVQLEDLYLPYKKKKKTRATIAKEKGLEPLAKIIMKQNNITDLEDLAKKYLNQDVTSIEDAFAGVQDIIAEWINENEYVRHRLRDLFRKSALIESKIVKTKSGEEDAQKFSNYFDYNEPLKKIASHRLLAILRGENEGFLKVNVTIDKKEAFKFLEYTLIKSIQPEVSWMIEEAIKDAYKRLLAPSISNEVLKEAKQKADETSIHVFSKNLNQLLLAPPLGEKRILAIDPGYKSGCKVVVLDEQGDLLHNENIYPHAPQNEKGQAIKKLKSIVNAYQVDAISIGNGTASRETENLVQNIAFDRPLKVFVVNEAGASIYSASKIARDEFPDKDVTVRGAVSIGRRLQDPLAELVKIEPKSIGVGQYQHDVDQTLLKSELDDVVSFCVNKVGVNLNTASKHLLNYVAGIGEKIAENIVDYRTENGAFNSRKELLKVPRLGEKAFLQASAFLRIPNAKNPLDNSAVHPESYAIVEKMAKDLNVELKDMIQNKELINQLDLNRYISEKVGLPTLEDIKKELEKPGLDPRSTAKVFSFDSRLKKFEDLQLGMKVPGIINNITNFGCFVDIGIKENGLIHISKISNEFISDVNSKVHLSQQIEVTVIGIDTEKRKIQLSLID